MHLTPTELERLTIFSAAELARKHRARGIKLSGPEAVAYICDELLTQAREGQSLAALMSRGSTLLTTDDVMPGVAELVPMIQVEAMFADGAKMITVHTPIRPGADPLADSSERRAGEIIFGSGDIELNAGRRKAMLTVLNTGDRAVQVASHYHFFEVNRVLSFDRAAAFGMRLDIPSGTTLRFEPGQSRAVALTEIAGTGEATGLNNLTNGSVRSAETKRQALKRARARGFKGA
ncbi:MAG: urease subunit gamma [Alphaproteobacteria bacterium]|nr:urease subunit gamma [Alphaproteobacteria bacterium]